MESQQISLESQLVEENKIEKNKLEHEKPEEGTAFEQLKSYFDNRIKLAKIVLIEKSSASVSKIASFLISILLGISALIFLSISLALYLGELLDSPYVGFMIVTGIYLFLVLLLVFLRKSVIEKTLVNLQIKKFFSSRL